MKVIEVCDDLVYIHHRQSYPVALGKPLYDTIDWLRLAKQKIALLRTIEGERGSIKEHPLDGLISLIDAIQDDADAKGYPVVWAYNAEEWRNGEIEIEETTSE